MELTERSVSYTVSLKISDIQALRSLADKRKLSVSKLLRDLISQAEKAA
jgi:hypothetical protein